MLRTCKFIQKLVHNKFDALLSVVKFDDFIESFAKAVIFTALRKVLLHEKRFLESPIVYN